MIRTRWTARAGAGICANFRNRKRWRTSVNTRISSNLLFPPTDWSLNSTVGLLSFISSDTFNRGTGVRLLGRSEPIIGGALPDLGTACDFIEQFGGALAETGL